MKLRQIFESEYPNNKKEVLEYKSDYYYSLSLVKKSNEQGWIFDWKKKEFATAYVKKWEGVYFEPYKTNAEYYILEDKEGEELGVLVFEHLEDSKRTRIWDIMIHTPYLRKGLGTLLLEFAEEQAKQSRQRSLVLECQSTNTKAIAFYLKNGFELIGFDLEAYTLEQGKGIEVRFEMGKQITKNI